MGPENSCDCVNGETSHPVGKEALKQIVVYIVDGDEKVDGPNVRYVRFIDDYYYGLNKDKYKETLSDTEKETLNKNGGLCVDSKWYIEDDYLTLIEESLSATEAMDVFLFDNAAVDSIKSFITSSADTNGSLITPDDFWNAILSYRK